MVRFHAHSRKQAFQGNRGRAVAWIGRRRRPRWRWRPSSTITRTFTGTTLPWMTSRWMKLPAPAPARRFPIRCLQFMTASRFSCWDVTGFRGGERGVVERPCPCIEGIRSGRQWLDERVITTGRAQKAMESACKKAGLPHFHHHLVPALLRFPGHRSDFPIGQPKW
jgi:hypothetical protein